MFVFERALRGDLEIKDLNFSRRKNMGEQVQRSEPFNAC